MPIYEYQCTCGRQFEKSVKFADKNVPQECVCGVKAPRIGVPETVAFTVNLKPTSMAPQNTGVSSFDANADRVIGADSKAKWEIISRRRKDKSEILRSDPDLVPDHVIRLPDGNYATQPEPERRTRAFLNNEAIELLKVKRGTKATSRASA